MSNTTRDWPTAEAKYVGGNMSMRDIARDMGLTNFHAVYEYARRHKWSDKRKLRQARTDQKKVEILADRAAIRAAMLEDLVDKTVLTIGEALDKLRRDMRDDKVAVGPRDLALLADRVLVLRGQPTQIHEERNLGLTLRGPVKSEQLEAILELTRGVSAVDGERPRGSAIPRLEDARTN